MILGTHAKLLAKIYNRNKVANAFNLNCELSNLFNGLNMRQYRLYHHNCPIHNNAEYMVINEVYW
jgi:hypothetical protein